MCIKQVTVFLENRKGRLFDITTTLTEAGVNILAISLADTQEYGLVRMIVSNPTLAKDALTASGFSVRLVDVLAVRVKNEKGQLHNLLAKIDAANLNIEYMYMLSSGKANGSMIVKAADPAVALDALKSGGLSVFSEAEVLALADE